MATSTKRIVFLGKTGSGKSSLANTIFGEDVFMVNHTSESGTSTCKAETRSVHGRSITLIDTPGFFDTNMSEEDLKAEILRCIVECAPGPHAFLILLKVEKISEQEESIIKKAEEYFGEDISKYATVVFTHGDQLQEGQKIKDFLRKNQSLMKKFSGSCHVVDNKYWNKENSTDKYRSNKFQVEQLLKSVDKMIKKNKGGYFSNEMLQKVREEIQEEGKRIRSSAENMTDKEIEERAKHNVFMKLLILFAGTSTGVLLGALLGVKIMVKAVVKLLKIWKTAAVTVKALTDAIAEVQNIAGGAAAATAGAATAGAAAVAAAGRGAAAAAAAAAAAGRGAAAAAGGAAKIAVGAMAVPAIVGGAAGGFTGYYAAVDAETSLEAMKKAAKEVTEGADSLLKTIEKCLID